MEVSVMRRFHLFVQLYPLSDKKNQAYVVLLIVLKFREVMQSPKFKTENHVSFPQSFLNLYLWLNK